MEDVVAVLLGQRGQVDTYARYVDALAATELPVVLTYGVELVFFLLDYVEGQRTIVEEDTSTYGYVVYEVHVVDIDDFVVGLSLGVSLEDDLVTSVELTLDFSISFEDRRTYFWALGIQQDGDTRRDSTGVVDDRGDPFLSHVGGVHTDDIDTSLYERTDEIYVAA